MTCQYCQSADQSEDFCTTCLATIRAPATSPSNDAIDDIGADELAKMDLPPSTPIIAGMIPVGLTVFAGRPKVGKSFAIYDMAMAVASGQPWNGQSVCHGRVLYLALEDSLQRLQVRLNDMTDAPPPLLRLANMCDGGLPMLESWIATRPDTRMIIIDTKQKMSKGKKGGYGKGYDDAGQLKAFADKHRIALILVHHTTKAQKRGSPLDSIMGDSGLTGAADAVLVLVANESGHGALWITGRDLPRTILPMTFTGSKWQLAVQHKAITGPQNAPIGPGRATTTQKASTTNLETIKWEWAYGITADQTALYMPAMRMSVKDTAPRLKEAGCVRFGRTIEYISEADLVGKFVKMGWKHKRIES